MRRARWALAIALVAAAGGWAWQRAHSTSPAPSSFAFDWPAGTRDVYSLRWSSHDDAVVAGMDQPLTGEIELAGELSLTSLGRQGDVFWLRATLADLAQHRVAMMGEDVLHDDAKAAENLVGPAAFLEIEPTGKLRSIRFPDDAPDIYRHVMQGLFSELQVTLVPEAAWQAALATTHGLAQVRYERSDLRVTRQRTGYQSLRAIPAADMARAHIDEHGAATIVLDPIGVIGAFDEDEQLHAVVDGQPRVTAALALHLVHLRRDRPLGAIAALPAHLEERHPGEPAVSAATTQRLLEQRVAGMTAEAMTDDLVAHANDGRMPDDHQWFSRASGYVILHPDAAAALAALFRDPHFTSVGRRLILDVLTAAGHPQAQAALRAALQSPEARGDAAYTLMLQRLSLLPSPAPETLAFLETSVRAADPKAAHALHMASAFSLGSAAGHLAANGDPATARRYNAELLGELDAARDARSTGELLRAIGNVGLDDNRPLVLAHRSDGDPTVRSAVAAALHKDGSPVAQQALIGLAQDPSGLVQQSALSSLSLHPLAAPEVVSLAGAVATDTITRANHATVVTILTASLEQPAATDALRHLLDHTQDSALKARISSILHDRGQR